ncbi:hypothetical protein JCM14076_23940 [Methylosoma difficile]
MNKIDELRNAHAQGFLSDEDFANRLSFLTSADNRNQQPENTSSLSSEATDLAKRLMKSDMATDMAAGAVGGAVIASVIPILGTGTGAIVGAAVGAFKNFTKSR